MKRITRSKWIRREEDAIEVFSRWYHGEKASLLAVEYQVSRGRIHQLTAQGRRFLSEVHRLPLFNRTWIASEVGRQMRVHEPAKPIAYSI